MADLPSLSFLVLQQPLQTQGAGKIRIEVKKTGIVGNNCSANVLLAGSSFYQPGAGQYSGRKLIVEWTASSPDSQFIEFDALLSGNKIEYLDLFLTDFFRCLPGQISRMTFGLHDPTVDPTKVFPPPDGAYSQVLTKTAEGEEIISFKPAFSIAVVPDSFISIGEGGGIDPTKVIGLKVDPLYFEIVEGGLTFKDSYSEQLARPPLIVEDINNLNLNVNQKLTTLNSRITQLQNTGVVAPRLLTIEGQQTDEVTELRIEHNWGINPTSVFTGSLINDEGKRETLGIAYEIEDNVAITFYPYSPTRFYYKLDALKYV